MPAQPSTIASAPSSASARRISASIVRRAAEPSSSSASTGTSAARTRAQREARPYFDEVPLDRRDRAGEGGDDAEFFRDQARQVKRRLADADDRRGGRAARGVEPGVVEAGDDEGVGVGRPGDLGEEAGHGEGLVEIALDARRPEFGIDGADLDAGRGGGLSRGADLPRHRGGRVGVDDADQHGMSLQTSPPR